MSNVSFIGDDVGKIKRTAYLHIITGSYHNYIIWLYNFDKILIPEMNTGQLCGIIRDKFMIPAIGFNQIKGVPFTATEIRNKITEVLK